jgi:hypothetical protein
MSVYQSDEERLAVEQQFAAIEARYGDRLDEQGRATVLARLLDFHRRAASIRQAPLSSGDEPLLRFAPRPARSDQ